MNDTDPYIVNLKFKKLAAMRPEEKMERFFKLCSAARKLVVAGIDQRYPNICPQEKEKRLGAILLGREFTLHQYDWDPDIEGY